MPIAAVAAAAIGAGATIYSANKQSKAIKNASQAQQAAADQAMALEERQYNDLAPWRAFGLGALQQLAQVNGISLPSSAIAGTSVGQSAGASQYLQSNPDVLQEYNSGRTGFDTPEEYAAWHYQRYGQSEGRNWPTAQPSNTASPATGAPSSNQTAASADPRLAGFYASPDYAFRVQEGTNAITNNAAARGLLDSGATGKALINYGQQQGSSEFANWYNRLAAAAGVGQTATVQSGNALSNQGGIIQNAAQNQASSYLAQAQNSSNTAGALAGIGSGLISNIFGGGSSNAYRTVPVSNAVQSNQLSPVSAQNNVSGLIPAGTGLYGALF